MNRDASINQPIDNQSIGREKCTASTSRGRCKRWPTRGATVCRTHGAGAPQVRAAAAGRVLDATVRATLTRLDAPPVDDPLTELSKLAGQVLSWRDALAERVDALTSIRYKASGAGTEQLRAEVAVFERALDRCAAVLVAMAKLNIDERMARISERQADLVIGAVDAALAAAGLSGPAAAEARQVAARHLRSVA